MPIVTFKDEAYECSKAIKGPDYVHLLDENDCLIASFDGVSDFSAFSCSTSWTEPTSEKNCRVAVVADGRIVASGMPCSYIKPIWQFSMPLESAAAKWTLSDGVYSKVYSDYSTADIEGTERPVVISVGDVDWAHTYLTVTVSYKKITLSTTVLPPADTSVVMLLIPSSRGVSYAI